MYYFLSVPVRIVLYYHGVGLSYLKLSFLAICYRYFLQRILLLKVEIHKKSYGIGSQGMTT